MSSASSQSKREFLQERVAHYLSSYRARRGLSQYQCAKQTGYSEAQIKYMEGKTPGSIVNSIETLQKLADLDNLDVTDFIKYLRQDSYNSKKRRSLYTWESTLLESFSRLPSKIRKRFIHEYLANLSDISSLEETLEISLMLSGLEAGDRKLIIAMILRLRRGDTNGVK